MRKIGLKIMREKAWRRYTKSLSRQFDNTHFPRELLEIVHDEDIARVIYYHIGSDAITWLDEYCPALEGHPKDYLANEENKAKLKAVLMRMH